ncbi:hypothetical protein V6N13_121897 [Hibiscus sabdariffa]
MSSSVANSIVLGVLWVSFATIMPAADQSPFESEAEALLESGWWSGTLHVGCNRPLYVNIPSQIGDLSALKRLSLSHCDLSGELPRPTRTLLQQQRILIFSTV